MKTITENQLTVHVEVGEERTTHEIRALEQEKLITQKKKKKNNLKYT